jgi:hypothetical protein
MNADPLVVFECNVCGRGMMGQPDAFDFNTGFTYCTEHTPQRPPLIIDIQAPQNPNGGKAN